MSEVIGPTGRFPLGKKYDDDEGELNIGLSVDSTTNIFRMDFGKKISWLGLPREQALQLADMIREQALEMPE